jgi:hypothetical protein
MSGEQQMRKDNSSPFADLALARAMRRVAEKYDDPDLFQHAEKCEAEAQAKIDELKAWQKRVLHVNPDLGSEMPPPANDH